MSDFESGIRIRDQLKQCVAVRWVWTAGTFDILHPSISDNRPA